MTQASSKKEAFSIDDDVLSFSSLEEDTICVDEDFEQEQGTISHTATSINKSSHLPTIDPNLSTGSTAVDKIAIDGSTDVTIGNQTYFQGTVIIKNLLTAAGDPHFNGKQRKISVSSTINITTKDTSSLGWWEANVKNSRKRLLIGIGALVLLALIIVGLLSLIITIASGNI